MHDLLAACARGPVASARRLPLLARRSTPPLRCIRMDLSFLRCRPPWSSLVGSLSSGKYRVPRGRRLLPLVLLGAESETRWPPPPPPPPDRRPLLGLCARLAVVRPAKSLAAAPLVPDPPREQTLPSLYLTPHPTRHQHVQRRPVPEPVRAPRRSVPTNHPAGREERPRPRAMEQRPTRLEGGFLSPLSLGGRSPARSRRAHLAVCRQAGLEGWPPGGLEGLLATRVRRARRPTSLRGTAVVPGPVGETEAPDDDVGVVSSEASLWATSSCSLRRALGVPRAALWSSTASPDLSPSRRPSFLTSQPSRLPRRSRRGRLWQRSYPHPEARPQGRSRAQGCPGRRRPGQEGPGRPARQVAAAAWRACAPRPPRRGARSVRRRGL